MQTATPRSSHRYKKITLAVIAVIIILLIIGRLYLEEWTTDYVNRVINGIEGYHGSVEDVDIHLYRGAYTIHKLKLSKNDNGVPVPFIDIEKVDFSIQWSALFHGKIVSEAELLAPQLNFTISQTGEGTDWTKPIKDLMPIDIDIVTVKEGKLSYKNFAAKPPVDLYIHKIQGEMRDLRNVEDKAVPLPSSIIVDGISIGGGKFHGEGKMNILKPIPDMDLDVKLESAQLPAINSFSRYSFGIDFEKGSLSVYSEFLLKDGIISGYVKPIAHDIEVIDLKKDHKPLKLLWESFASLVIQIFKNQPHDQLATRAEIHGDLNNIRTNKWSIVQGILKNAFIQAFSPNLDKDVGLGVKGKAK